MSDRAAYRRDRTLTAPPGWAYALALVIASLLALEVYAPALRGPFVFDDLTLPFASGVTAEAPLSSWITGVRPVLMLSYWFDHQTAGTTTLSFHLVNLLLHLFNAVLVFVLLRRLLIGQGEAVPAAVFTGALFGASVFLLHPIQTESVAYIAGRSEVLSASFVLLALAIYLPRARTGVSWRAAVAIAILFAAGAAAKEQTIATLPACILLTDWLIWRMGPIAAVRRNYRLYVVLLGPALAAGVYVCRLILTSPSVGSALAGVVSPAQHFFTQCRAIFVYVRLLLFPYGQNVDHDFEVSRTIFSGGAWLGLLGLLGIAAAAIFWRRRYPLFSYGVLLFGALLAPTSSIIPLADPLVEHRLYLPMFGLLVVASAWVASLRVPTGALAFRLAAVVVILALLTANRAKVWSDSVLFWQDVVAKAPGKARPYPHLVYSYMLAGRCQEAVAHMERVERVLPQDYLILLNWAQAYECANKRAEALRKVEQAAALTPRAEVFAIMASLLDRLGERERARKALELAVEKQPEATELGQIYRAQLLQISGSLDRAEQAYQQALAHNPRSPEAQAGLRQIVLTRQTAQDGSQSVTRSRTP